jgi:hypothetical protein
MKLPLRRPYQSVSCSLGIAARGDVVCQIYGLSETTWAEPDCHRAEDTQIDRFAVNMFRRRPGLRGQSRQAPK